MSLSVGLNLDLVIHNFNWDTTIYSENVGCASTPRPPPTLDVAAIGQPAGVCNVPVGSDVQGFTATRSDGASDPPITWKLENGISGDSITSAGELTTAAPGGQILIVKRHRQHRPQRLDPVRGRHPCGISRHRPT